MATRAESTREARRRRIVERGSDRLALITGRIQSLPDQSPPAADSSQQQNIATGLPLPTQNSIRTASQHDILNDTVEPLVPNTNQDRSSASIAASLHSITEEFLSSSVQTPALDREDEQRSHCNSLTTGQIRSAIAASENIRICCSVAAAILVILSYVGIPVLGWRLVRSIILSGPLYLLLLTNVTIVLARLILGARHSELKTGRNSSVSLVGGNGLVDQMGKALEAALLLQNVSGALFMDFGIYAVVLVCGLSLLR